MLIRPLGAFIPIKRNPGQPPKAYLTFLLLLLVLNALLAPKGKKRFNWLKLVKEFTN